MINKLNPWYVTGFCDGESAFTYSRSGSNINLYFAIRLSFEDRDLLYKIYDYFGVGKIYVGKPSLPGKYSGHTQTSFYYRVSKISDLQVIIEHFNKYPLIGKKALSYSIWKDMVSLKGRYRKPNLTELNVLAEKLSGLSNKNTKIKKQYAENNSTL